VSGDIKTGGWSLGERLTSAQMNTARAEIIKSVDGVAGGTYTPAATVSISDLTVGSGNQLRYDSRTVGRPCIRITDGTTSEDAIDPVTRRWARACAGTTRPYWITQVTGNVPLWFPMRLPVGSVLNTIVAVVVGGAGHGALPAVMPEVTAYSSTPGAMATLTTLGTQLDTSASVGLFQAAHVITISGLSHTVLSTLDYWLRVLPESGANDEVGFIVAGATAGVTMTEQDEWT
jgi:hypothetical protein